MTAKFYRTTYKGHLCFAVQLPYRKPKLFQSSDRAAAYLLWGRYRLEIGLTIEGTSDMMPPFNYNKPVEFRDIPAPGLCYVTQGEHSAIVPAIALESVSAHVAE
jgi:hypothetical protein